jgi:DNA-binding response OmpR family regulator
MESALIIDDDAELCVMLQDYLKLHGMSLAMRHDGGTGLTAAQEGDYDMVILDVMLPGRDGFDVLRHLRAVSDINVLLLTARGEDVDRIVGLEAGADDYLSKPFNPRELLARMRAIFRRADARQRHSHVKPVKPAPITVAGFVMDITARTVHYEEQLLPLTNVEFALLEVFLQSPGTVHDREDLMQRILERPFHPFDRSLDMHVSRLRKKLDSTVRLGSLIKTIRSAGYLFAVPDCS